MAGEGEQNIYVAHKNKKDDKTLQSGGKVKFEKKSVTASVLSIGQSTFFPSGGDEHAETIEITNKVNIYAFELCRLWFFCFVLFCFYLLIFVSKLVTNWTEANLCQLKTVCVCK